MVQVFKDVMRGRGIRSQEALLRRTEGELDAVYDFIHQIFGQEEATVRVLAGALKKALRRSKVERYEKYLKLWVFRMAVESIQKAYAAFEAERIPNQILPLDFLTLEEKMVLLLVDRTGLDGQEVASVLQVSPGRVGRSLAYGREKVAKQMGLRWKTQLALQQRISLNLQLLKEENSSPYGAALLAAREKIGGLESKRFSQIESSVRQERLLPLLSRPEGVRWKDLSWQSKLGLEASALLGVGLFAVVVLPWVFSQVNAGAFVEGRFGEVFRTESVAKEAVPVTEISADRLLASSAMDAEKISAAELQEEDEFADVDFPSGDAYEAGTAPLAPSRQAAAVYRLIVQSASPKELIPQVRTLFVQKNVRERERSGQEMPGGVYFDGITNVGNYPLLVQEIQKLGQTKSYSHPGASKNPNERARVIVWVQQI